MKKGNASIDYKIMWAVAFKNSATLAVIFLILYFDKISNWWVIIPAMTLTSYTSNKNES